MSKINAVRLINLNYNNNAIKVSDETFHMNGESTLFSLRNGGGKSVLVQMMMAPFVHKRYRDAKDRPFESYFTTAKPTFILVEWVLDQKAGYVLTGMMVRRSQSMEEGRSDNLDMVNFVSEYREPCSTDIHHLPVVEKGKKEMTLKNFAACRQLFEEFKKDSSSHFFYYDMMNTAQSRQYFDKLMEYQINYREWESIIKKVNLEESGLSNLFADCRDERGLVEKWFLEAVEGKLNKEKNRMKEFQAITGKYVGQYKDNQSKIQRRDTIRLFKEEGKRIEEKALHYQGIEGKKEQQENRIACFIRDIAMLKDTVQGKLQETQAGLEEVQRAVERVQYEKLSNEYHETAQRQRFHISNRDMIAMEQEELEREYRACEDKRHLLSCVRQQNMVIAEKAELEEIRQKLAVCQREKEDLAPERDYLGHVLKGHYEGLLAKNQADWEEKDSEKGQAEKDILGWQGNIQETEHALRENATREGALGSSVRAYDEQEQQFNVRYGTKLTRNILGLYEPGALEIQRETEQRQLEEAVRQQRKRRKELEDAREQSRNLQRHSEQLGKEIQQREWERQQKEKLRTVYEEELSVRSAILKYLELGEEDLFDTEKILRVSERKLQEIAELRRVLEKEEDSLQKEYQKLTQGKVLELPEELQQDLADIGIHIVYGMEWLRKNGYSEKRNKEIVKNHPLLPYALILSGKELEKLAQHTEGIYTSFPIPVIRRELLEEKTDQVSGSSVIDFPGISFYVLFNENLLSEEKLAELVRGIEQRIQRKKEAAARRDEEYKEYFQRKEMIRNQKVSRERDRVNKEELEELGVQIETLAEEKQQALEQLAQLADRVALLEQKIREADREIDRTERRVADFSQLCTAYEVYEENCRELEHCQQEGKRLEEKKELAYSQVEKRQNELESLRMELDALAQIRRDLHESCRQYAGYDGSVPEGAVSDELKAMDIEDQEARFRAVTANLSQELQELERQEQKALRRYQEAEQDLEDLQEKYDLEPEQWAGMQYSKKEETHLEIQCEGLIKKKDHKSMLWNEENTEAAVLKSQMDTCVKRIQTECGREEPLAREKIQDRDFDAVRNQLEHKRKEIQKTADAHKELLQGYEENLTALAEYSELPVGESVEWEEPLTELSRVQLRRQKGELVRDHKEILERRRDAREQLVRVLNQILRMEVFADEYYQKPLENMLALTESASQVLRQLDTTVQSYEDLMEKLEIDISVVEKEKERIVELMEEYIHDVHTGLGKIDANSTITIRERSLKMLKIQLPEWEENENLYHIRLSDLIDEITRRGIEIFERNENAQEYFGTQITTKNLYDTVIGISEIQIRLYKVEEQREYPITWAEVAKNSGGEGFLSAFVILSSLLYYMRKDDTDFFADRNEGKVLLMDNPFAQTNASHLLKPLMDMAKKANTQLICLSGLGGESIYNRFDNIYVLNLVAASLRNGMQYLKTDHVKGSEPDVMVVSQIEVVEQMELVF